MKKTILFSVLGAAAALVAAPAGAQEISGRVLSTTPLIQQVQVPRQVCNIQPVAVQQPGSGADTCTTQTTLENRTVGYNVTYEYAGNQYTVQMAQDPGPTIRLQLSPVGANAPGSYPNGGIPIINQVIVPTAVAYPVYYTRPYYYYYPPVGVSMGIGYYRGYGYGYRGHGHGHRH